MSRWEVKLPTFEGPLDLLLFLVTRKEYDIMDLPMAEITESYLAVIDSIGVDNLEDAGDYLLMAATLLSIKTKMMLPQPVGLEDDDIEDPRRELAQRLLLYAKVKEVAADLAELETDMIDRRTAGMIPVPADAAPTPDELLYPMTVYELTKAMEEILDRRNQRLFHEVSLITVTVEDRIRWIIDLLRKHDRFGLLEQLGDRTERIIWVVTLLALLEMAKQGRVNLQQNECFSEVYISDSGVSSQAA
jgi:segregation and condensation protein A